MCVVARIDARDENTSWTQNLGALQEDDDNAYVFWAGVNVNYKSPPSGAHNSEIWVRPIDKATLALGTAFRIDFDDVVGGDVQWDWDGVAVCRLDSGIMIAVYGTSYLGVGESIHGKESAANDYQTWGARQAFTPSGQGRCAGGLVTDGTNVWLLSQDNNTADLYIHERTGVNTWALATTALTNGKIFDSSGFSATAPFFCVSTSAPQTALSAMRYGYRNGNAGFFVLPYAQTSTTIDAMACLRTEDNWATTETVVLLKDYSASLDSIAAGAAPKVRVDSEGLVWAMWIEDNDAAGKFVPVFATSDDGGATWSFLGAPTPLTAFNWDNTWDGAFAIDPDGVIYVSGFDSSDGSNLKHRLYKYGGGAFLTDWTETVCEHLADTAIDAIAGGSHADAFINSEGDFVRVFNGTIAPGINTVDYLIEEGVFTPDTPPPPLVEPTTADTANTYLRWRLAEKRGWSAHDLSLTCMGNWPEGDYATQRQKRELIGVVGSIDPTVDDPEHLAALYRMDVPDHFGKQVFYTGPDGTVIPRLDPFPFLVESGPFRIAGSLETGVLRGFQIQYWRENAPLTIEVRIDDRTVQTYDLPVTPGGRDGAGLIKFVPVETMENVGSFASFLIRADDLHYVAIGDMSAMRINKGVRG